MGGVRTEVTVSSFDRLMLRIAEKLLALASDLEANQAKLNAATWEAFRHDADYVKHLQSADFLAQNLTGIGKLIGMLSECAPSVPLPDLQAALRSIDLESLASDLSGDEGAPVETVDRLAGDVCFF